MFKDRKEAGERLGVALDHYRNKNALVVGIPRGGIETAFYVARHLKAELVPVITRKLGFPFNPEAAMGAVAEDGSFFLFDSTKKEIEGKELKSILTKEEAEIRRRINVFRQGKPLPSMKGRIVIVVDDGIATGATVFATLQLCKKQGPSRLVIASPVADTGMEAQLHSFADEVVILLTPPFFGAVSQGYANFENLTDEETLSILKRWDREHQSTKQELP